MSKADKTIYNTDNLENLYRIFSESTGVTTDSRAVSQGSIFFAIKGDNFDGNRFALAALEAGAAYAVIDDPAIVKAITEETSIADNSRKNALKDSLILTENALVALQIGRAHV